MRSKRVFVVFFPWVSSSFFQDAFDQHVYMERWERLPGGRGPFFAIRRRPSRYSFGVTARVAFLHLKENRSKDRDNRSVEIHTYPHQTRSTPGAPFVVQLDSRCLPPLMLIAGSQQVPRGSHGPLPKAGEPLDCVIQLRATRAEIGRLFMRVIDPPPPTLCPFLPLPRQMPRSMLATCIGVSAPPTPFWWCAGITSA